jgi:hypothetical protein
MNATFDARRLLTTTNQPSPRPSPVAQPADEHRGARWALIVMIVLIAIAHALATAPPRCQPVLSTALNPRYNYPSGCANKRGAGS